MTQTNGKIYITGVAGMIGSNAARALIEEGNTVIGVDNFWRGTKDNIVDLLSHKKFTFIHADLLSDYDWYCNMDSSDVLIHIADIVAGIDYVFSNEWNIFQRNLLINTNVARVVNQMSPERLIYLGTACSYPKHLQQSVSTSKLSESDKFPADPESGYGWSKLIGEIEFRLATNSTDTKFVVLDLHNVYGWPCIYNDNTSQVIPALIYKALNAADKKLSVWGDGNQGRAFVHVYDVISAINLALRYKGPLSSFMFGPDHCTTISEVAHLIILHPKIDIEEIVFDISKPTGDIGRFADLTKTSKELGWYPKINFQSGLHDLIDHIIDDLKK